MQVNDQYVKIANMCARLVWHEHTQENELFFSCAVI